MENKIKLRPKALQQLQQIQQQRQQLNQLLQDANQREAALLELIFEEQNINGKVSNLRLDVDSLVYTVEEVKPKVKQPKKKDESIT